MPVKKAGGIEPSSTSSPNVTPAPGAAGSSRSPTVARMSLSSAPRIRTAAALRTGRSMQTVVVCPEDDFEAVLLGERRGDHLLLHLAVERHRQLLVLAQVDQRVLLGELGERDAQRVAVVRLRGEDDGLERRRREVMCARAVPGRGRAHRVADPHGVEALQAPDPAGLDRVAPHGGAAVEHVDGRDLALREPVAHADRPGAHPHVGELLARRAALDLEHRAGRGRGGVSLRCREQRRDPGHQLRHALARARGAGEHRLHSLGTGRQLVRDLVEHPRGIGAAPVGLVDEQQRRHAQALERAHQHARLRLYALDGRDDEHGAVEHAQRPLHLRDEVGVPWRVYEVDRDVADGERDDGGLDRDPAPPLEREGVGLRAARVDAAGLVDHPGRVEQPFGEGGLTGVDVCEHSKVQRAHCASCPPRESGWSWT